MLNLTTTEKERKRKINWKKLGIENLLSGLVGLTSGTIAGGAFKYLGTDMHPVLYGALVTPLSDCVQKFIFGSPKQVKELAQDDVGTFTGNTVGYILGYYLASLIP